MRAWVLGLAALVAGCDLLPDDSGLRTENHVTWVTVRGDHVPVLNPGTAMDRAAIGVQRTWPNLAAAEAAVSPRWTAAHPQNSFLGALNGRPPHGELVGFGATLVRQSNTDFPPGPEDFPAATGELNRPTLLFFDMRAGGDPANWPIIGMGYAFPYKDEDEDGTAEAPFIFGDQPGPQLKWNLIEASYFFRDGFLTHEAGYHVHLFGAAFDLASTADLTDDARAGGLRIDAAGLSPIGHADMKGGGPHRAKHGRFFTIHVFFEPGTGRATVAPCDPWARFSTDAVAVPVGSFYYRDDPTSLTRVDVQCRNGGGYPTINELAPD